MTHLKRMFIGFVILLYMALIVGAATAVIALVDRLLNINPVVLFYGTLGLVCFFIASYCLGVVFEEFKKWRQQ